MGVVLHNGFENPFQPTEEAANSVEEWLVHKLPYDSHRYDSNCCPRHVNQPGRSQGLLICKYISFSALVTFNACLNAKSGSFRAGVPSHAPEKRSRDENH
jgi:hypothetical protein